MPKLLRVVCGVVGVVVALALDPAHASDLCAAQAFCKCPEAAKSVACSCESINQPLNLTHESIPKQTESISISGCGHVIVHTDTFARCPDLRHIELDNLKQLELRSKFFSKKELEYKELSTWSLSRIGSLSLQAEAFVHFPKVSQASFVQVGLPVLKERAFEIHTDNFTLRESTIGSIEKGALYSDAFRLSISNNRIEVIRSGAFDASVRTFEFIGNTVDLVEHSGFSVACLHGKIVGNTFQNQTGSPFLDFGPDPVCMPDKEADAEEEEVVYNVVANPTLEFTDNTFLEFSDELLNFPGANGVPLGALDIRANKIRCDCERLKSFAALVDFEHAAPRDHNLGRGALLFRKEFYDSGQCSDKSSSLKGYLRSWLVVHDEDGPLTGAAQTLTCSDPKLRKQSPRNVVREKSLDSDESGSALMAHRSHTSAAQAGASSPALVLLSMITSLRLART